MQVKQQLDALTSLRFVAASMIVVLHTGEFNGTFSREHPPLIAYGQGVSFFFVLSGFILAYVYPKLDTWPEILSFWRARIARIWPAFFATFVLTFWLLNLDWDYKTGLANLLLVNAWIPVRSYFFSYNFPTWSISTEFFFYLAFPLLIYRWNQTWKIKLLVAAAMVAALTLLSNSLAVHVSASTDDEDVISLSMLPISRIFEFILGIAVAAYWRKQVGLIQWQEFRATLYEIGAILLCVASMYFSGSFGTWVGKTWTDPASSYGFGRLGSMLAFGLLIYVMSAGRGRISAWLSHPWMVLLGEISFSIYLLHQPLLRYYQTYRPAFPSTLAIVVFWAVLLLASYLMWAVIEMPCRRLILGRSQKNIHGTKVMQESWHTHLNLNQKTLSAATVLACLITSICILSDNNPKRISDSDADATTPGELGSVVGTRFGNLFGLRGLRIVRRPEGLIIYLAWESLIEQHLTYTTGLYFTDAKGKDLFLSINKQPKTIFAEKPGALWGDVILISADQLSGLERKMAIAVYQFTNHPLPVDRGNRDWNNHRLLIDLGDVFASANRDSFSPP